MTKTALFPVVAAAMIDAQGRVLLQQRPPGRSLAGLWEFPGGKIEAGETPEAALVRELAEELGVTVPVGVPQAAAFASVPLEGRHLLLLLFLVRRWEGVPRPIEATELRWVAPTGMAALPMPPADRPLVAWLARFLDC